MYIAVCIIYLRMCHYHWAVSSKAWGVIPLSIVTVYSLWQLADAQYIPAGYTGVPALKCKTFLHY